MMRTVGVAFVIAIIFLFLDSEAVREACPPSSCGMVKNISYPFRLNTDPQKCGDPPYELLCEGNRTVLHLNSSNHFYYESPTSVPRKKYYVEEIWYGKEVIRVVDPCLQTNSCLSLASYSLWSPPFPYYELQSEPLPENTPVTLVQCSIPINSLSYVEATCFGASSQRYLYAVVGLVPVSDLNASCKVAYSTLSSSVGGAQQHNCSEMHDLLLKGFELSWKRPPSWKQLLSWKRWNRYTCIRRNYPESHTCFLDPFTVIIRGILQLLVLTIWVYFCIQKIIGVPCVVAFIIYKFRRRHIWMDATIEEFLSNYQSRTPTRYSYSDVRKMTKDFKEKLGQGGYGTVFKGKLRSGRRVAVKVLAKSKANGQEFINEVATIGRIHHVNVVPLIGFCSEGCKRALIYDFMPNGSLEKYIFSHEERSNRLSWEETYQIALGIARGIDYLHQGCDMQILHFDIKPHNILLDKDFTPKVSDFGLAKYYSTDVSIVSITAVRGTLGYIAPELLYKNLGGVSYKSDVYSFGMLLMEMAGKRKNVEAQAKSSEVYFPLWIYDQLDQGGDMGVENATEDEKDIAKKLFMVALWCIQMKPTDRPSMRTVLEMLEENVEPLQMPAKPFLSSPEREPPKNDSTDTDTTASLTISVSGSTSQKHEESSIISVILN